MPPPAHLLTITLVEQAAPHAGAPHAPPHPRLHRGSGGTLYLSALSIAFGLSPALRAFSSVVSMRYGLNGATAS